jgi:hypothetical protein
MVLAQPNIMDFSEDVFDKAFWKAMAPDFHVCEDKDPQVLNMSDEQKQGANADLIREGYFHWKGAGINSPFEDMANLFAKLVVKGLPPVFSFVFDELWELNRQLNDFLKTSLHDDYAMMPDFWAWMVQPGEAGWQPHRDKGPGCLFPDRSPKSLTVWIPVTKARPLNGCMYVLPADRDSKYAISQGFDGNLADIRALPGDPGDAFFWTQHVFHWGSHSAEKHDLPPRMSVAFEYQRTDLPAYNTPLLDPMKLPDFESRLALIAKQVLQYTHMYQFTDDLIAIAEAIKARHELPSCLSGKEPAQA